MSDVDERSGQFAEACWAWERGERAAAPAGAEFGLHPYLADGLARECKRAYQRVAAVENAVAILSRRERRRRRKS